MKHAARIAARFSALMFAVSIATFLLVSASPVNPVQASIGQSAYATMGAAKRRQLEQRWGVRKSLPERYGAWLSGALRGDLGDSLRFDEPVARVVGERLERSALLLFIAWIISGALGVALGVLAGAHQGSWLDRIIKGYCYVLSAAPTFWLGLLGLMVFAVHLRWFPIGFAAPIGAWTGTGPVELLHHAALPALTLSVSGVAGIALHTREKTVDVMASDYIRFARTRGERGLTLIARHGLRNLALPALMLQFASIGEILGGSILVEQVFSYPGLGQAAVAAGLTGDAPLLVGIALITAALVFAGNIAADALACRIDPRLSKETSHGI